MRKARETHSTKERAELLLSSLERLRAEVSVIEARHGILKADYTKICEDAILKISSMKTDLEKDIESKIGDSEVFKPKMSNLEARFKLGLVPAETYLTQNDVVNEDITAPPGGLQYIIDKVAGSIEFGLDKMGDGIIFPAEKMVNGCTAIFKVVSRKPKK